MTGDQADIYARIKSTLPFSWFGDTNPILDSVITGLSSAIAWAYSFYAYAVLQTRIKTATDEWLDFIAFDFFGDTIQRKFKQADDVFRKIILVNLFRERATRRGLVSVLEELTGYTPDIFEPSRPFDTGAYNSAKSLAYGMAGGYGSMMLPFQAFVTAYAINAYGVQNVGGYGSTVGGYGIASQLEYISLDMATGSISNFDIYNAINATKPEATLIWTAIKPPKPVVYYGARIGIDAIIGTSIIEPDELYPTPPPEPEFIYTVGVDAIIGKAIIH